MTRPAETRPRTLTLPHDFVAAGLVAPAEAEALARVSARYSAAVTGHLAALVDATDPADPIARQFVPDPRELETTPQERADPIGDDAHSPCEGLVHRYPDRVLLKIVSACPVYCRFCFRRETVGAAKGGMLAPEKLAAALDYIRARPQIWEVILTGGDPLALSPRRLAETVRAIAAIDRLVSQVAKFVSIGQLPSASRESKMKRKQSCATGRLPWPMAARFINTKLVNGTASRYPPLLGCIVRKTRNVGSIARLRSFLSSRFLGGAL